MVHLQLNARTNARARVHVALVLSLLAPALVASCKSGDSTAPPGGTATVNVEAAGNSVEVGGTLQLTATALDASGNNLSKTFAWASSNQGVAVVSPTGLVNGVAVGAATISATADGKSGNFTVTVTAPTVPLISAVSPSPLVAGQTATLTGDNFSTTPTSNIVTIGGAAVTVTAATKTSLTVAVPSALCTAGTAAVKVSVNGRASNSLLQPAPKTGTDVTVATGKQTILTNPADFCLQFAATGANEAYLVGVQNLTESGTSVQSVIVGNASATGAESAATLPVAASSMQPAAPTTADLARMKRWDRQRAGELTLRMAERAQIPFAQVASNIRQSLRGTASLTAAASVVPGTVQVGDNVTVRIPDRNRSLCQNYAEITTVVRLVGLHSIWLEDSGNPANGYTAADFTTMAADFDNTIYQNDVDYFGEPSDLDNNGRIVMIVTKEVNKEGVLGFTTSADFQTRTQCPSSNGGEVFYTIAPDPNGTYADAYARADGLADAPILTGHEFSHILQFVNRAAAGVSTPAAIWELEGQATLAEEITGHKFTSRSPGQNYGFNVAFMGIYNNALASDHAWYAAGFFDLALYWGFNGACDPNVTGQCDTKISGTPEQCTWLAANTGAPCFPGREVYGVPWSLLRYISDQFSTRFAGGEKELHHKLITDPGTGFQTLANVSGQPINVLLAPLGRRAVRR